MTASTGDTFFADQSPPNDLEESVQRSIHFAEAHISGGRPLVLVTVSFKQRHVLNRGKDVWERDGDSLPPADRALAELDGLRIN